MRSAYIARSADRIDYVQQPADAARCHQETEDAELLIFWEPLTKASATVRERYGDGVVQSTSEPKRERAQARRRKP